MTFTMSSCFLRVGFGHPFFENTFVAVAKIPHFFISPVRIAKSTPFLMILRPEIASQKVPLFLRNRERWCSALHQRVEVPGITLFVQDKKGLKHLELILSLLLLMAILSKQKN